MTGGGAVGNRLELGQASASSSLHPHANPVIASDGMWLKCQMAISSLKCCNQVTSGVGCLIKVLGRCCKPLLASLFRVGCMYLFKPYSQVDGFSSPQTGSLVPGEALSSGRTVAEWLTAVKWSAVLS